MTEGQAAGRPRVIVLQHVIHEPLGLLEHALSAAVSLRTLPAYADPVQYSHAVDDLVCRGGYDAVVALGGPVGVYERDRVEFIDHSLRLLRDALRRDVPVLGLCLGAQLVAWTLGSQVRPGRTLGLRKEIGWHRVHLTDRGRVDPAFHGFRDEEPVFQWHGDTFDVPEGAWRLAGSSLYRDQAFRWGRWVYGLQFHVEVTPELVARWTEAYASELAALEYVDVAGLVPLAERYAPLLRERSLALGRHFVECIRTSCSERDRRGAPAVDGTIESL